MTKTSIPNAPRRGDTFTVGSLDYFVTQVTHKEWEPEPIVHCRFLAYPKSYCSLQFTLSEFVEMFG
jgi:hypothetical protein